MKRILFFPLVLILLFSASLAFPQQPQSTQKCDYAVDPAKVSTELQGITQLLPARGGSVDWGLALSGGGIRSGSFSIGAMKALYDLGFMDRIDVISSVSGGGYASYWLFTSYDPQKQQKFGEDAFKDDVFLTNVCNLPARTFFPLQSMLAAIFQSKDGAFNDYEAAINDTFGNNEPVERTPRDRKINYLQSSITAQKVPYFILNTTISTKDNNRLCKVFELTPTHMGNPSKGFYKWTEDEDHILRWSEGIAMASAGIRWKLGRPVPKYASNVKALPNERLSDGGHSENLAAFSLIRRGVKNIIIVDAGLDPNYLFSDYKKLRDSLASMDIEFAVEHIETFLKERKKREMFTKAAVSKGYARSKVVGDGTPAINSQILYIKMSLPESIFPGKVEDTAAYNRGQEVTEKRRKELEDNEWDCNADSVVKFGFQGDMFIYRVKNYSEYLNGHRFWRRMGRVYSSLRYNFPHTTTVDQTFFRDQLEAFIGLGYLQAIELEKYRDW